MWKSKEKKELREEGSKSKCEIGRQGNVTSEKLNTNKETEEEKKEPDDEKEKNRTRKRKKKTDKE